MLLSRQRSNFFKYFKQLQSEVKEFDFEKLSTRVDLHTPTMELYENAYHTIPYNKSSYHTIPYIKSMEKLIIIQFSYIFKNN